jgi:hypothetical protein
MLPTMVGWTLTKTAGIGELLDGGEHRNDLEPVFIFC